MDATQKREVLAESPLFDNLLPPELTMLAELFSVRDFGEEDTVFEQGSVGDSLFVIASGQVEVLRDNPAGDHARIAVLDAPLFFGEMSLIDKEFRSATIRATSPTVLLQLKNENLHVFAKHYRNGFTWLVVNIARTLSSRLRDVNQRLAEKL